MTLVNLAELTAALAERDAARAEVARLRAAVEKTILGFEYAPDPSRTGAYRLAGEIRRAIDAALAATEDQP